MKRKLISALVGITMVATMAVGCSKSSNESKESAKAKSDVKAEQVDAKSLCISSVGTKCDRW
ncbi:hypothetical protein Q5M85_06240 [Paraclostridium bifermentans]|nr:hypothetical protein [Paraclostridium bifermentans]